MKKPKEYESIKLPKDLIKRMRAHKDKTGVPIITFAAMAISDALAYFKNSTTPKK